MKKFLALMLLGMPCFAAPTASPRIADERIVLHTPAGDIVLALYPDAAPEHVAQILKLTRLGVYDSTDFYRIFPGYLAQIGGASERLIPLTPEQSAAIHPLRAEFSALKHHYGSLSMAHEDADPNSARDSFSILLRDWPEGDGHYTIFGQVETGMDVVEELQKAPRRPDGKPLFRLNVFKAEVKTKAELAKIKLMPVQPLRFPADMPNQMSYQMGNVVESAQTSVLTAGVGLMTLVAVAAFLCSGKFPRTTTSLNLINVLIGAFLLLIKLTPMVRLHSGLSYLLFFGLLGVLNLMTCFEKPASSD